MNCNHALRACQYGTPAFRRQNGVDTARMSVLGAGRKAVLGGQYDHASVFRGACHFAHGAGEGAVAGDPVLTVDLCGVKKIEKCFLLIHKMCFLLLSLCGLLFHIDTLLW